MITNNPSTIDQKQQLLVKFPNLGENDVLMCGTIRLTFTIILGPTDVNKNNIHNIVQNLGRAIVKKTMIKIRGNDVMSVDESDVYYCYNGLWTMAKARENAHYQGIDIIRQRNVIGLHIRNASVKADVADAATSETGSTFL